MIFNITLYAFGQELWEVIILQSSDDHKLLKLEKMLDKENRDSVKNFNPGQKGRLLPSFPRRKVLIP